MIACALPDISAFLFLVVIVIGLSAWRWNGRYDSEDPMYPFDTGEGPRTRRYHQ